MRTGSLRKALFESLLSLAFLCLLASPVFGAVQAGRAAVSDDARTLSDAWGAFRAKNILLAREKAEKIKGVSGPIGDEAKQISKMIEDIQVISRKMDRVRTALYRSDSQTACTLLSEVQATIEAGSSDFKRFYSDLNFYNEKQKAGGCVAQVPVPPPAPAVDKYKSDYDKALSRRENGRSQDALAILNRIHSENPDYKDVKNLISEINQELRDNQKKSQDQLFADAVNATGRAFDKGNLITAREHLKKAEAIHPSDPAVKGWADRIRKGIEQDERELEEAITAFYQGKYPEAEKGLEGFLRRAHSPRVVAFARFYAGAAQVSDYYVTGARDQQKKEAAASSFAQSFKEDPEYSPRWETVSPKIKSLYFEVNKKTQ